MRDLILSHFKKNRITVKEVSARLGMSTQTFYTTRLDNIGNFKVSEAQILSDCFGVSIVSPEKIIFNDIR